MDQMTYDKMTVTIELKPEDTLSIVAPNGEYWGWVDLIVLDVGDTTQASGLAEGEAVQTGDGYIIYQAEFFHNQLAEGFAADLQPGSVIDIPMSACEGFTDGWYTITIVSCGPRESIYLRLNGTSIGSVSRKATGYGADQMTENRYSKKIELTKDDVLTLVAPDDDTFGWVDYVRLNAVDPPTSARTEEETIATEPVDTPSGSDTNSMMPVVYGIIGVVVFAAILCGVIIFVRRKK